MKLIYIVNARIPTEKAHGIQIMKMCEAFVDANNTNQGANIANKIDVELVVPQRRNNIIKDPFEYYGIEKKFKITKLPCLDLIPLNLGKFGYLFQAASFLIFAKFYLFFKKYNILYTREPLVGLFFKNYVLELHNLPRKITGVHKKIWHKAKLLVVLTSYLKEDLIAAGIDGEKIFVAPDGVDLEKFDIDISKEEARKKLDLPLDKKIILYAGSFYLYGWKGIDVLLEAAKELGNECLVVLIGGNEKEIKNIKNRQSLENVLLLERRPHYEMPFYLKTADVLVLPNKRGDETSERYTSPLKLFEYMASGTPIVASDLPSVREALNENNAILVKPGDCKDLLRGIETALHDANFTHKISEVAFKNIQNGTWKNRAKNIFNFIKYENFA
jgi:glycosyltransferase involved in cell wall biosynthesis